MWRPSVIARSTLRHLPIRNPIAQGRQRLKIEHRGQSLEMLQKLGL
jgi:hypothetical protein